MNEAQVETLRPETLQPARVASEGETPTPAPSFISNCATEKKGARPAFEALPQRHPTPAQIDAAIADAWTRFEALDDARDMDAYRAAQDALRARVGATCAAPVPNTRNETLPHSPHFRRAGGFLRGNAR